MKSTTTDNTKKFDVYNQIDDSYYPNSQAKITRKRYKIDNGECEMNILSKLINELKEREEWLEKQKEALAEVVKNIIISD